MKLILSRHLEQNKKVFYNSIREKLNNNEMVYIIVPEQFTLGTEIEAYDKLDIESTFNLRIKSFKSIIKEILHKIGGRGYKFVSDSTKFIILQSVLLQNKNELNVFNKNIYDKEFVEILLNFIEEMNKNDYGIDEIEKIIELGNISKELKNKLSDALILLKSYTQLLTNSDFSVESMEDIAIKNIGNMEYFRDINFYIYRFHDMSRKELKILSEINKISKETILNISIDDRLVMPKNDKFEDYLVKDSDVFSISEKFIQSLQRDEFENNIEFISNNKKDDDCNEIEKFLDNVFSFDLDEVSKKFKNSNKKVSNISLRRTKNTEEEVENTVIEINKFIREGNRFNDMAILVTNSQEYYPIIKRLFKLNEIPFFLDENRSLLDNAMIKNIKASISLLDSKLSQISIIDFLKYSFLSIEEEKIEAFQSFIERRRISGSMIFDDKYFQKQKRKENNTRYEKEDDIKLEQVKEVLNILREIILEIPELKDTIIKDKKLDMKDYVKYVYTLLTNEYLSNGYENYKESINFENKEELIEENKIIWERFIDTLDELYNVEFGESFNLNILSDILFASIDNFKVGIIPPSKDQIVIGDPLRSRFNKVKKLFVLGMSNLYYPITIERSDLLSDEEKEELINLDSEIFTTNIDITSIKETINSNNLLSFYELLYTSNKYIDFSYSLINSSNEGMNSASLVDSIKEIIKEENIYEKDIDENDYIYSKTILQKYVPHKLRESKQGLLDKKEEKDLEYLISEIKSNKDNFSDITNAIELTKADYTRKKLSKDTVNMIFNTNKFSVSQLEEFNSNPYDHFIKYGLKPREHNTYDISALDIGNILHNYMKDYFENRHLKSIEKESKEIFYEAINNTIDDFKIEDDKNQFFINQMERNANQYSKIIDRQLSITHVDDFMLEKEYRKRRSEADDVIDAIEVDIDGRKILIEGKIDRIDVFNYNGRKYFRIIDYKTGNKEFEIGKIYAGVDMQLLLYLNAVLNQNKDSKPLGVFYQKLRDDLDIIGMKQINLDSNSDKLKAYKLSGIINDDIDLYNYIDSEALDEKQYVKSEQYNYEGRKSAFKDKNNVVSENFFEKLIKKNEDNVIKSIERLLDGVIDLQPYKFGSFKSDKFSNYTTIHKDEGKLSYRNLEKYSWDEIKEKFGE